MAQPISCEIAWANDSVRSRIRPWMRSSSAALLWGELNDQVVKARRASATATATSCALPIAISATGSSVDGSMTTLRSCPAGRTHVPPMKMRSRRPALARRSMMAMFMRGNPLQRRRGVSAARPSSWLMGDKAAIKLALICVAEEAPLLRVGARASGSVSRRPRQRSRTRSRGLSVPGRKNSRFAHAR
jgi:hypothetical protein